jgi:hypothetical protein
MAWNSFRSKDFRILIKFGHCRFFLQKPALLCGQPG